jgi:gliding motility-associated-like protein
MKSIYIFLVSILSLGLHSLRAQVLINEISAANRAIVADDYGDYEDYIELYNAGPAAVDISSFFLSDEPANPTKWQIPAGTVINAGTYRLFFCSGRDENNGLALHTNFKLNQMNGETVLFSNNIGTLLDSYALSPIQVNHSWGRQPNGGNWRVFTTPTPGSANGATSFSGYADTPQFSLAPGIYAGAQTIDIISGDAGYTVRYTLDGAEPSATSPQFTTPITVNASTVIRARAFPANGSGFLPSFIASNTYLIGVSHDMPIASWISDEYDDLFASGWQEIPAALEYFSPTGQLLFESFGEVDRHGNDSWAFNQKGVGFIVRDQYGYDDQIDYPIFPTSPRQEFQRIIFKAGASDNYPFTWGPGCHLRDAFIQSLAERANLNVDLRRNQHCAVYINGQYWGLYEVRERVNDPDYTDYYWNQEEEDLDMLSFWGGLEVRYGSADDWNDLYNYIMTNDMTDPANYGAVSGRLDVASLIDYTILNTWSVNSDWMNWNTMWWRGRGTPPVRWKYILWDMDNVFDLGQNYSNWPTTGFNADPCDLDDQFQNAGPEEGHLNVYNRLLANPEFKQRFVNRYAELINTYLGCEYALAHFDSIKAHIETEMPRQIARWGGTMAEWQDNIDYMRGQIVGRCEYIEEQGVVNCYEVDGPHRMAFQVVPAGGGTIKFNELTIPNYPWSGSYFGGVEGDLEATPSSPAYVFDYWEVFNSTLNGATTDAINSFMIAGADSIVAHFRVVETHDITFVIEPPNGGTVSINGITPGAFPFSNTYNDGFPLSLTATADPNYDFVEYAAANHTFSPDPLQTSVFLEASADDTIFIRFIPKQTWLLTVQVQPEGSGKVLLNSDWLQEYPHTEVYFPQTLINIDNYAFEEFEFDRWELQYHSFTDSSLSVNSFVIDTTDTLIAHFKLKEVIPQTMYVPSGFTPNGDNLNDVFEVYHTETVSQGNIRIFNRWGEQVFQSDKLDFSWDGTINGRPLPDDVYFYVLNYFLKDEYFETAQGRISITR